MKAEAFDARRSQALRQDWSSEANAWFFLLGSEDILQVRSCRGAQNQLGLGTALFAGILVHGCHLLLTTMADVANIPYQQLTYISERRKSTTGQGKERDRNLSFLPLFAHHIFLKRTNRPN
jgi:hypothetical protein